MRACAKYQNEKDLHWFHMDVRVMQPPGESFDVVIDKGTMDCVLCSKFPDEHCTQMCDEVCRVLRPGGTFLVISHATQSLSFLNYFDKPSHNWNVQSTQLMAGASTHGDNHQARELAVPGICLAPL